MKAIILAAGENKEIAPYIGDLPKCMLSIDGETIIGRQIRILGNVGINESDIIVVVGYNSKKIILPKNVATLENVEYRNSGNAYSLALGLIEVMENYENEDAIVLDGDLVYDTEVLYNLVNADGSVIIDKDKVVSFGKTGVVSRNGRVISIGKHIVGDKTFENILKIKYSQIYEIVGLLEQYKNSWYTIALDKILNQAEFCELTVNGYLREINSFQDYQDVLRDMGANGETILVTGASGFLGKKIYYLLKRKYNVKGICRKTNSYSEFARVDLTDFDKVKAYIELNRPKIIVHTAAIPDPETCERDKNYAKRVNVDVVKNLVEICNLRGIKLIQLSTDYVFSGEKSEEYNLNDVCDPINYYGETKANAEEIVKTCNSYLIIRVPILYGYNDEDDKDTFPIKVIKKLSVGEEIKVDGEQIRYPVLIDEIAHAVEQSLDDTGVMHVTSEHGVTKHQWAHVIAKEFGLNGDLIKEKNGTLNKRPKHVKLSTKEHGTVVSSVKIGTTILKKQMGCAFKLIYKSSAEREVFGYQVGAFRFQMGEKLGRELSQDVVREIDCIVPVPTSGLYYAMGVSQETKIPYVQALTKPQAENRSFQIVDISSREDMIRDKICIIPELLHNKTIALVDEAIFTGTTLRVVCDMIKACGVKDIFILIPTPLSKSRCRQYVMPNREILSEKVSDMEEYFGARKVIFQTEKEYGDVMKTIPNICYECLK